MIAETLGRGQVQREAIAAQEARNAGYLQNHTDATNAWRDFYYDELGDPVGAMEQKVDGHVINIIRDVIEHRVSQPPNIGYIPIGPELPGIGQQAIPVVPRVGVQQGVFESMHGAGVFDRIARWALRSQGVEIVD